MKYYIPGIPANIRDHLGVKDIAGAVGDILGRNTNGQHLKEVTDGLQGLRNSVESLTRTLGRRDLTSSQKEAIQSTIGETSKHIDRVEKILETARAAQ